MLLRRVYCDTASYTCEWFGATSTCQSAHTLDEPIPSGSDKVGALRRDAVPTPLEHLDDYGLVGGGGTFAKRAGFERTVAFDGRGESCSRSHEEGKLRPGRHG